MSINWWEINDETKEILIEQLTSELDILRTKAKVNQEDLASAVGLSRQTYNQIETGKVKMSWTLYLAILFFFISIDSTAKLMKTLEIYPNKYLGIIP